MSIGRHLSLVLLGLVTMASAQGQKASPTRPSVIDSTYVPPEINYFWTETVHLYQDNRTLKWDINLRPKEKGMKGLDYSFSFDYDNVIFVEYKPQEIETVPPSLHVGDSLGHDYIVPLPAGREGEKMAEYVARKSPKGLDLIGRAWRVRKPFEALIFCKAGWKIARSRWS